MNVTANKKFKEQVPVFQKADNAIHRINHYPVDSVVFFSSTLIRWIALSSL